MTTAAGIDAAGSKGFCRIFMHYSIDKCNKTHYTLNMITSFQHKGLEKFYKTGSKAGIQPKHADKLNIQLTALNIAKVASDLNFSGWNLHELKGDQKSRWSIKVNGNWRVTFMFVGEDVILVDYEDYH